MPDAQRILAIGPSRGGVADAFEASVGALRARGHRVDVLTVPVSPAAARDGIRAARRARAALDRADVVHIEFGANDAEVVWFALAAVRRRSDCVLVAHDHPELVHAPAAALLPSTRRRTRALGHRVLSPRLDARLVGALVARAGVLVGFGDAAASSRQAAGARAVATIVHGAAPATLTPRPPSQGDSILFAGYIGPSKGVDVLLAAWRRSRHELALPLVLAGAAHPPHDAWLATLQHDLGPGPNPPQLLGAVRSPADFQALIERAAIVVLPYRSSNPASGILVRAMSAGRAIVATRVPATTGVLRDGDNGLLVAPGDVNALVEALARLSGDGPLRDRLGSAAARTARSAFSTDLHVDGLQVAYDLAARGRSRR
jgi:glycosyltransferase involved in cell wall biosynthesis